MAKEGHAKLTVEERRKILLKKLELSGLKSWTEENKERALDLLAKYHDIFALEDGETGCTKATEHKIEVPDPKPFKERPRNIPSGLLEEVKDHLDHMLDVGVIKPSKLAWSNAVVLVLVLKAIFDNLTSGTSRRAEVEYCIDSAAHCKADSMGVSVKSVMLSTQMHVTDWAEAQHEDPEIEAAMDWCHLDMEKSEPWIEQLVKLKS